MMSKYNFFWINLSQFVFICETVKTVWGTFIFEQLKFWLQYFVHFVTNKRNKGKQNKKKKGEIEEVEE